MASFQWRLGFGSPGFRAAFKNGNDICRLDVVVPAIAEHRTDVHGTYGSHCFDTTIVDRRIGRIGLVADDGFLIPRSAIRIFWRGCCIHIPRSAIRNPRSFFASPNRPSAPAKSSIRVGLLR
jgi:hypothetical protein